jgi:hypothetical protein
MELQVRGSGGTDRLRNIVDKEIWPILKIPMELHLSLFLVEKNDQ